MKECNHCILHDGIKGVKINDVGTCNYCEWDRVMNKRYPISDKLFKEQMQEIKEKGKNNRYDAVIGISGGCDSSYLLKKMVENDVRCLAVHWDNNWNTDTAISNMDNITNHLKVDLKIRRIPRRIYDNLCKSFLLASTPDADIPNDIALATVLYQEAKQENIKSIINGHSFRTEGTCPTGWTYMDGKYIESVNKGFLKTDLTKFPNMTLMNWLNWLDIKRYRPLYYLDYRKPQAKKELEKIGWIDYGGHHAENMYTKFVGGYLWYLKFNQDLRYVSLSAQIRNDHITKTQAKEQMKKQTFSVSDENDILPMIKTRLFFSDQEFDDMMNSKVKSYKDYETYDFRKYRELFIEYKDNLPQTFIDKYIEGL